MDTIGAPNILDVPLLNSQGELLSKYYQFTIDSNHKIPVEELFPDRQNNLINQDDFGVLLNSIKEGLRIMEQDTVGEK